MKTLITGGAGFIGSHLVDRLLAEGHQVTVLDDLSTGRMANVQHHLHNNRFRFIKGNILAATQVEEAIKGSELVLHLAAAVGIPYVVEDPLKGMLINVRGTEVVLELAHQQGARVLLASTSEVYGKSTAVPFAEEADRTLGPTSIRRWAYATAKALDEHMAYAYQDRGLRISIVRYFNAYGPRLDPRGYGSVIAKFVIQALAGQPITVYGDGLQTRSFTYIDDAVEGTLLTATRQEALGEVFNIGRAEEITIYRLAELIKEVTNSPSEILLVPYDQAYSHSFEDPRRRHPDVSKAARLLGFQARVPLLDGLEKAIQWMRQQLELAGAP